MIEVKTESAKAKEKRLSGEDVEREKWQSEADARTLAEAEDIKSDPARYKKAREAAKKQSEFYTKVIK